MSASLCFLDCETDGIHPNRRPWEIAIIRREPDGRETEWAAFVEIDLSTADPFGLRVGRFYERHPFGRYLSHRGEEDAPGTVSPIDAALETARLTHGAHIVGAVPNFDTETLAPLLREHGLTPAWHYHLIDIENLAVGYLAARGQRFHPPYRSDELTEALGLDPTPPDERHTALGDARWAQRVYDAVMAPAVPDFEVDDIVDAVLNLTTDQSNRVDDIAPGLYTAAMSLAHTRLARDLAGDVR
jgi:hypothetical protein